MDNRFYFGFNTSEERKKRRKAELYSMSEHIVGLPNVGKSTLFNALTSTANAQSANYPFCTIEPNVGVESGRAHV